MKNLATIDRVTESQIDRHPRELSIQVGEIFLCLISINSLTHFALLAGGLIENIFPQVFLK